MFGSGLLGIRAELDMVADAMILSAGAGRNLNPPCCPQVHDGVSTPADVIKQRMQLHGADGGYGRSMWTCIHKTYAERVFPPHPHRPKQQRVTSPSPHPEVAIMSLRGATNRRVCSLTRG